jgi:hypothetical protein
VLFLPWSSESGTGPTQPHEYSWELLGRKSNECFGGDPLHWASSGCSFGILRYTFSPILKVVGVGQVKNWHFCWFKVSVTFFVFGNNNNNNNVYGFCAVNCRRICRPSWLPGRKRNGTSRTKWGREVGSGNRRPSRRPTSVPRQLPVVAGDPESNSEAPRAPRAVVEQRLEGVEEAEQGGRKRNCTACVGPLTMRRSEWKLSP